MQMKWDKHHVLLIDMIQQRHSLQEFQFFANFCHGATLLKHFLEHTASVFFLHHIQCPRVHSKMLMNDEV